jgi:hypothetical protein
VIPVVRDTRGYRALFWLACFIAAFLVGRQFSATGNDFVVYHAAARSLISGRVDLYSNTFALGPPMVYVYPPLFLLLVFPIGWLEFQNAFGLCFASMAVALISVTRLVAREWRPASLGVYGTLIIFLTGPYVTLTFRSGNAHLLVSLLLVFGLVAWTQGRLWWTSAAVAIGGAIKIFPLFLLPVFAVRRDWALLKRSMVLTIVIWALPALYFGPARTIDLYRAWYSAIGNIDAFKQQRAMDLSASGALGRWMAPVDYSRYVDARYPQVNILNAPAPVVRGATLAVAALVWALTLWMCARLRPGEANPRHIAAVGALFITAMLLAEPYTPIQHLSAWIIAAMALPVAMGAGTRGRLLVIIALVNVLLFAIPGAANQRALQAYGAFTLIGFALWGFAMDAARSLIRSGAQASKARSGAASLQ